MPDIHDEILTRAFVLQRQVIRETHNTDPLGKIDKLAMPETMVHGQARDPTRPNPATKTDASASADKDAGGHGKSDADTELDPQYKKTGTKPTT